MNEQLIAETAALLTPREAHALSGVDRKTWNRWARAGMLDPVRTPGGHNRYRPADVRRLAKLNRGRR